MEIHVRLGADKEGNIKGLICIHCQIQARSVNTLPQRSGYPGINRLLFTEAQKRFGLMT